MSDSPQINSFTENNVHFIEIPTQSENSQITFTIRYSAKPKVTEEVNKEESEEALLVSPQFIVDEVNRNVPPRDKTLHETSKMLISLTVSTVMMMATRMTDIPHTYLIWTDKFLKCCKDRNGEHPTNIQRILDILEKDEDATYIDAITCPCPSFFYKKKP